ncbi:MAG: YkgJ family cysteine cluster protein, partial [Deltaproteobacteria bacterium]
MTDHPETRRLRTVAGARFTCQRTGFCCRFHQLGPVEPDRLQALIDSDPPSWWPPAAARPWTRVVMGPHGLVTELARVDGHCIFLGDDQRCAIYTHLGGDARPGFCRLFPFHVVQDADGVSVTIRESCAGRQAAQQEGLPVAHQAA